MTANYFESIVGTGNKKDEERNENDFYPTPPIALFALSKYFDIPGPVWEPACGKGHLVAEMKRLGLKTFASDLHSYSDKYSPSVDFLAADLPNVDTKSIITNPPYKNRLAEKFVLRSLEHETVEFHAFLCRLQFMTSITRYDGIFSKKPPTDILVFPKRLNCNEEAASARRAEDQLGGMLEYAWFVWRKRDSLFFSTKTEVRWVDMDRVIRDWNEENGV
jgi:hypothetical protein